MGDWRRQCCWRRCGLWRRRCRLRLWRRCLRCFGCRRRRFHHNARHRSQVRQHDRPPRSPCRTGLNQCRCRQWFRRLLHRRRCLLLCSLAQLVQRLRRRLMVDGHDARRHLLRRRAYDLQFDFGAFRQRHGQRDFHVALGRPQSHERLRCRFSLGRRLRRWWKHDGLEYRSCRQCSHGGWWRKNLYKR